MNDTPSVEDIERFMRERDRREIAAQMAAEWAEAERRRLCSHADQGEVSRADGRRIAGGCSYCRLMGANG